MTQGTDPTTMARTVPDLDRKKATIRQALLQAHQNGGMDAVGALMPRPVWDANSDTLDTDGWAHDSYSTMFRTMRNIPSPDGAPGGGKAATGAAPAAHEDAALVNADVGGDVAPPAALLAGAADDAAPPLQEEDAALVNADVGGDVTPPGDVAAARLAGASRRLPSKKKTPPHSSTHAGNADAPPAVPLASAEDANVPPAALLNGAADALDDIDVGAVLVGAADADDADDADAPPAGVLVADVAVVPPDVAPPAVVPPADVAPPAALVDEVVDARTGCHRMNRRPWSFVRLSVYSYFRCIVRRPSH